MATTRIQHGRRASGSAAGRREAMPEVQGTAVISKQDWMRIQSHLQAGPDRAAEAQAERERLYKLSEQSMSR